MVVNAVVFFDPPLAAGRDTGNTRFRMFVTGEQHRAKGREETVAFTRAELSRILSVYGHFVAAGEWRDYAIDHLRDAAVFSVFRRAAETPVYRIEKRPALAQRQGAYLVISMSGLIMKRGHDLAQVLRVFDRQRLKLAE